MPSGRVETRASSQTSRSSSSTSSSTRWYASPSTAEPTDEKELPPALSGAGRCLLNDRSLVAAETGITCQRGEGGRRAQAVGEG